MNPIRVLIVDDSAAVRQLVAEELDRDPAFEVAGAVANGALALAELARLTPDAIVLDLDMPILDGLGTLERLRRIDARLPVVVFSAQAEDVAEPTLQALWLGANDCVAKPRAGDLAAGRAVVREQLIPRLAALVEAQRARRDRLARPTTAERLENPASAQMDTPLASPRALIVAIGASTGGPRALATLLTELPEEVETPVLIVQHMPAEFTRHLATHLAAASGRRVREAQHGAALAPGDVWIAPGDRHLLVDGRPGDARLVVERSDPENGCRPSANPLLRSVARVHGPNALAVILTGMGRDGLAGCAAVRAERGRVLAQDEASSVVWGMPRAVIAAGLADRVLPLDAIAGEITRRTRIPPRRAA